MKKLLLLSLIGLCSCDVLFTEEPMTVRYYPQPYYYTPYNPYKRTPPPKPRPLDPPGIYYHSKNTHRR